MGTPKIKINGKEYTPAPVKAKVWREVMEFQDSKKDTDVTDWIDKHAEMIAKVFARPEVSEADVLANIDLSDIVPLYNQCFDYLVEEVNAKLSQIPNAAAAAD